MKLIKLSARLQQIASYLPEGCKLADIGSDHALLPVYAVQSGRAVQAVAGEINEGPYEAATRQVAEAGLVNKVDVRKGDGLAVIEANEVDSITIAGMGGALIATILTEGADKLAGVHRLVLQPNVGEDHVRRWLLMHGWVIIEESILEEDGKIYEVISAVPEKLADQGANEELYKPYPLHTGIVLPQELLLMMGPLLVRHPSEVFIRKWNSEINKLEAIRSNVAASQLEASREKERELTRIIQQLEEVLTCLQKAKP